MESVLAVDGPLDGQVFELLFQPGEDIDLNTAAGPCVYRFDLHERVARYVGPLEWHPVSA